MPDLSLRLAVALLGGVFAWSAVAKPLNFHDWRAALSRYAIPEPVTKAVLIGVPIAELAVPLLFVAGETLAAAALSLTLLSAFTLAVLRARRAAGDKLPCGCFGKLKKRDYRVTLVRNALLGFTAAVVLVDGKEFALFDGFALPQGSELLAGLLLVVGVAVCGWLVRVAGTSLGREEI